MVMVVWVHTKNLGSEKCGEILFTSCLTSGKLDFHLHHVYCPAMYWRVIRDQPGNKLANGSHHQIAHAPRLTTKPSIPSGSAHLVLLRPLSLQLFLAFLPPWKQLLLLPRSWGLLKVLFALPLNRWIDITATLMHVTHFKGYMMYTWHQHLLFLPTRKKENYSFYEWVIVNSFT